MKRLCPIENNSIHHIYTKSIYQFEIFTCPQEFERMQQLITFYQYDKHSLSFSKFIRQSKFNKNGFYLNLSQNLGSKRTLINILAYCIMPTHVHFLLKQAESKGIEVFMGRLLNAYTRYFNLRHNRRGPLWEHRFSNKIITDDQYFFTAKNYIYNNPVEAGLVNTAQEWQYSYLGNPGGCQG